MKYRMGMVGQAYNTGLGNIAWGFEEHFRPKTLLVDKKPMNKFPERFKNHRITQEVVQNDIDWLLEDIDILFTVETPYNWDLYTQAKKRGIKTVLMPMYEWLDKSQSSLKDVDLFICPSEYYEFDVPGRKIHVPTEVPVDLKKFKPKKVKQAKRFLHNAGHQGILGRNSTTELMNAIPLVKSDVEFVINSQMGIPGIQRNNVTLNNANYENYWEMYNGEDVYILIGKYGISYLGVAEAMASGMPIIFSDIEPFNKYLPKELLVKPLKVVDIKLHHFEKFALFSPEDIARKIDEVAQMDLTEYSELSIELARQWSWDVWEEKYNQIFTKLCEDKLN